MFLLKYLFIYKDYSYIIMHTVKYETRIVLYLRLDAFDLVIRMLICAKIYLLIDFENNYKSLKYS